MKDNIEAAVLNGAAFDFGHIQAVQEKLVQNPAQAARFIGNCQHNGNDGCLLRYLHILGNANELGEVRHHVGNPGSQNVQAVQVGAFFRTNCCNGVVAGFAYHFCSGGSVAVIPAHQSSGTQEIAALGQRLGMRVHS